MEANKYRILFVAIFIFIGVAIYINSGTPTEDLDPKTLNMKNIKKIEVKRVRDNKVIILNDSVHFKPLINNLLSSNKIKIKNPRYSKGEFYVRIFFHERNPLLFGFQESKNEGKFFWGDSGFYKNDSLYLKLHELPF